MFCFSATGGSIYLLYYCFYYCKRICSGGFNTDRAIHFNIYILPKKNNHQNAQLHLNAHQRRKTFCIYCSYNIHQQGLEFDPLNVHSGVLCDVMGCGTKVTFFVDVFMVKQNNTVCLNNFLENRKISEGKYFNK